MHLRIVLVETQGPLNLGSIARVMKNMGLADLWLVNPICAATDPNALLMAVHGQDILENVKYATSLPEALQGCQRAVATAGRLDRGTLPTVSPAMGLSWLQEVACGALVFGSEERGLSNQEIQYCQKVIQIPTANTYPSLNLAQAAAICCYQWQELLPQKPIVAPSPETPPIEALEGFYNQLESLLLEIGYLYPHTAFARMQKFRHMLNRCQPTVAEITMLRGVLHQVSWAIHGQGERQ